MVGQMPGVNFWSDKCQEDNIVTIWLPISHFVNLTFSQSDILKFLYFDNLTILHGWQLHIVDNLDILTIWKFNNLKILHLKFNNLKSWHLTLLTIWNCWQFEIVDNLTLLTIWHCWQFDIVDNLTLLIILHCWYLTLDTWPYQCLQYWYLTNWWNVS